MRYAQPLDGIDAGGHSQRKIFSMENRRLTPTKVASKSDDSGRRTGALSKCSRIMHLTANRRAVGQTVKSKLHQLPVISGE